MSSSTSSTGHAPLPLRWVGPIRFIGPEIEGDVSVPLATFETPLWPSTERGARVATAAGGVRAVVVDERMSRSILLEAPSAVAAAELARALPSRAAELQEIVATTSRFARLIDTHCQVIGRQLFVRFAFTTGDAAGHNMVTAAADALMTWLLQQYPDFAYGSISGNLCTDKKVSAVNGLLGRGKNVVVEATIPAKLCRRYLKTTAARIVDLNWKKNWIGSNIAGGVRTANAHFANMLLAFYLATGQDAANIVEGSQGFTTAEEVDDGDLYFSVTLPNLIVGSVGSGKGLDWVTEHLEQLGCREDREPGVNARRLAVLAAATVWCGELSLLAAQTNPGELMQAHLSMERG
jgi:hydroxymethylglutaryl-CoA reductase (NADPH)